jgi:hypothetical protein
MDRQSNRSNRKRLQDLVVELLPLENIQKAKFKGTTDTTTKKRQFLMHYFDQQYVGSACNRTGMSRSLYKKWRVEDPVFADAADQVIEARLDLAEHMLLNNIAVGKETSLIFFLKTIGKNRGYKQEEEKQTTDHALTESELINLPNQDLIKLLK